MKTENKRFCSEVTFVLHRRHHTPKKTIFSHKIQFDLDICLWQDLSLKILFFLIRIMFPEKTYHMTIPVSLLTSCSLQ